MSTSMSAGLLPADTYLDCAGDYEIGFDAVSYGVVLSPDRLAEVHAHNAGVRWTDRKAKLRRAARRAKKTRSMRAERAAALAKDFEAIRRQYAGRP
jgi:hypothetical protein